MIDGLGGVRFVWSYRADGCPFAGDNNDMSSAEQVLFASPNPSQLRIVRKFYCRSSLRLIPENDADTNGWLVTYIFQMLLGSKRHKELTTTNFEFIYHPCSCHQGWLVSTFLTVGPDYGDVRSGWFSRRGMRTPGSEWSWPVGVDIMRNKWSTKTICIVELCLVPIDDQEIIENRGTISSLTIKQN